MNEVGWECWNQWTLTELPRHNRSILSGGEALGELVADLNSSVLARLPTAQSLSPEDARRLLVLLGLAGASVARHHQEEDLSRKLRPGKSFEPLRAGPGGTPFLDYFAQAATATGTGHAGRDCYASLVRWNAPTTRVEMDGETLAVLPGSFPDLDIRTYTNEPGEFAFFELLKKSEAFEFAANEALEPVAEGSVGILSDEAARRAATAARLLTALVRFNQAFAVRPPEHGGLSTGHFMDVFRQFAVHWEPGDLPPTGAQDPEFLRRDLMLGIAFPRYAEHVRRVYPALLADEREQLDRGISRRPLPALLLDALGLDTSTLSDCTPLRLGELVRQQPRLVPWYLLLAANAKLGAVHLMLTERFLFKPQRDRDRTGIGDRELVSNRRGTTGMEEPLLVRLTRARRDHPLRGLGRIPDRALAALCDIDSVDFEGARLPTARFVPTAR